MESLFILYLCSHSISIFMIALSVLVPPHPPTIYSADGKRMADRLGPYKLGSALVATCVNSGGFPPPRLSWWRDDVMIDDTYEEVSGEVSH